MPAKARRADRCTGPGQPPRPSPGNGDGPGRALVTGSLAYDFILDYHGDFKPKLDIRKGVRHTSVFEVGNLRRAMGGCAGNIAYTMAQLGSDPVLIGAVGEDGGPYIKHLRRCGINGGEVRRLDSVLTAQAFVVNDRGQNQLIFFFPGAMERTHEVALEPHLDGVRMAILAPSSRESTLAHAAVLAKEGVPIMLDLGQGLQLFDKGELRLLLGQATHAIFNRMEFDGFCRAAEMGADEVAGAVGALIVTDSMSGSTVHAGGERHRVPARILGETVDPTGCGDAYRGALAHAVLRGHGWREAGEFASRIAGIKALHLGGQSHRLAPADREIG